MVLIEIEKISYRKKDGNQAEGLKLYYSEDVPNNKALEGQRCDSVYIPSTRYEDLPVLNDIEIGMEFDILYNRFGGVKDIKILM